MKSLLRQRHKLGKFWSLSYRDKKLFVRVLGVLIVYRGLLLVVPFNRFIAASGQSSDYPANLSEQTIRGLVWAISVVSVNVPVGFTCLVQALATKRLLKNHPDVQLHIGVRKSETDGFAAHAWVSYKGKTILGDQTSQAFESILQWS